MAVLHYMGAQLAAPDGLFCPDDRIEIDIPDSYFDNTSMEHGIGLPLTRVTLIRDGDRLDLPVGSGVASFHTKTREDPVTDAPREPDNVTPFHHLFRAITAQKDRRDQLTDQRLQDELRLEGAA